MTYRIELPLRGLSLTCINDTDLHQRDDVRLFLLNLSDSAGQLRIRIFRRTKTTTGRCAF